MKMGGHFSLFYLQEVASIAVSAGQERDSLLQAPHGQLRGYGEEPSHL